MTASAISVQHPAEMYEVLCLEYIGARFCFVGSVHSNSEFQIGKFKNLGMVFAILNDFQDLLCNTCSLQANITLSELLRPVTFIDKVIFSDCSFTSFQRFV